MNSDEQKKFKFDTPHDHELLKHGGRAGYCCEHASRQSGDCLGHFKIDEATGEFVIDEATGKQVIEECYDPQDCECYEEPKVKYCGAHDGETPGMECLHWPIRAHAGKAKHIHELRIKNWHLEQENKELHESNAALIKAAQTNKKRNLDIDSLERIVKRIKNSV